MKLPFSDEIREAREAVARSQEALRVDQRLKAARTAMAIVTAQFARRLPVPPELPGDDLIEELAAAFPELADLPSVLTPSASVDIRLLQRTQQIELAASMLAPLVEVAEADAERLHGLQHRQHHALEGPEWADAVAELAELGARRDEVALEMAPLRHQLALIGPVTEMLLGFCPQLEGELALAATTEDPNGVTAWRTAVMAHNQLVGLASVIAQLGLVVQLPVEPAIPDQPHPRHGPRLRKEAEDVLLWMRTLHEALSDHLGVLQGQMSTLEARHAEAEAALVERMG